MSEDREFLNKIKARQGLLLTEYNGRQLDLNSPPSVLNPIYGFAPKGKVRYKPTVNQRLSIEKFLGRSIPDPETRHISSPEYVFDVKKKEDETQEEIQEEDPTLNVEEEEESETMSKKIEEIYKKKTPLVEVSEEDPFWLRIIKNNIYIVGAAALGGIIYLRYNIQKLLPKRVNQNSQIDIPQTTGKKSCNDMLNSIGL